MWLAFITSISPLESHLNAFDVDPGVAGCKNLTKHSSVATM